MARKGDRVVFFEKSYERKTLGSSVGYSRASGSQRRSLGGLLLLLHGLVVGGVLGTLCDRIGGSQRLLLDGLGLWRDHAGGRKDGRLLLDSLGLNGTSKVSHEQASATNNGNGASQGSVSASFDQVDLSRALPDHEELEGPLSTFCEVGKAVVLWVPVLLFDDPLAGVRDGNKCVFSACVGQGNEHLLGCQGLRSRGIDLVQEIAVQAVRNLYPVSKLDIGVGGAHLAKIVARVTSGTKAEHDNIPGVAIYLAAEGAELGPGLGELDAQLLVQILLCQGPRVAAHQGKLGSESLQGLSHGRSVEHRAVQARIVATLGHLLLLGDSWSLGARVASIDHLLVVWCILGSGNDIRHGLGLRGRLNLGRPCLFGQQNGSVVRKGLRELTFPLLAGLHGLGDGFDDPVDVVRGLSEDSLEVLDVLVIESGIGDPIRQGEHFFPQWIGMDLEERIVDISTEHLDRRFHRRSIEKVATMGPADYQAFVGLVEPRTLLFGDRNGV